MEKLPRMKIASAAGALLLLGFSAGCQTAGEAPTEPAYVVGATPLSMRLDPIVWGTIAHFDIVAVDGDAPHSKARVSVTPGQHTITINAIGGFGGRENSATVDFKAESGHTYLLRPTSIGGLIFALVIDNDEGMVVFRPKLTITATSEGAVAYSAAPAPAPRKADAVVFNANGSVKTKKVYQNDSKGRVVKETLYDGSGAVLSSVSYAYGPDGHLVQTQERGPDGKLQKVVVYFDTFTKTFDGDGNVIGTGNLPTR
jgi:hypothetical protein